MNDKAYKFSVRDDTSFRVESGGSEGKYNVKTVVLHVDNQSDYELLFAGSCFIIKLSAPGAEPIVHRNYGISDHYTMDYDILLIDGRMPIEITDSEGNYDFGQINIDGNIELEEAPTNYYIITGDASITIKNRLE